MSRRKKNSYIRKLTHAFIKLVMGLGATFALLMVITSTEVEITLKKRSNSKFNTITQFVDSAWTTVASAKEMIQ